VSKCPHTFKVSKRGTKYGGSNCTLNRKCTPRKGGRLNSKSRDSVRPISEWSKIPMGDHQFFLQAQPYFITNFKIVCNLILIVSPCVLVVFSLQNIMNFLLEVLDPLNKCVSLSASF
jgi:hypothetical protein